MRLANQGRQNVAVGKLVIVVRAVEVGGHDTDESRTALAVAAFAELDAGNLGDGVGFVGLFERAGEQVFLLDRLGAVARVDATGAEKAEILYAGLEGAVDE